MKPSHEELGISKIIHLITTLILLISFQFMIGFVFNLLDLENIEQEFISFILTFKTISIWIIWILIFINICLIASQFINLNEKDKGFVDDIGAVTHAKLGVATNPKTVPVSNSLTLKNNKEKSNSSVSLDVQQPNKTIYYPNVDKILSMIHYVEDLQKQIKNSLNINNENQITSALASLSPLSDIDQSIFVKFNILKEKFMLDYQAIDWKNNINQEISNFYQKIYDKHLNILQEQYDYIKNYLKDYFDDQAIKSEEILDLIKRIIN